MFHTGRANIFCFECVRQVDDCVIDGVEHVFCATCEHSDTLEKALDDCFVFTVAHAVQGTLAADRHTYRFMPRATSLGKSLQAKNHMLVTGRARRAA